jgi:hypothetical protein
VRGLAAVGLAITVGLAVPTLSACNSPGGGSAAASATGTADVLAVWQRFAVCARAHGVPNLPDPQLDSHGKATFPGFDAHDEPADVKIACQTILNQLPPDSRSNPAPTDIRALLRYAQCMRTHSFPDWPDPKADGTFPAAQLPSAKTPALVAAMQACDSLNPDKRGHVYGS